MIPTRTWITPFERLYALQRELDHTLSQPESMESGAFVPAMDVVETNDEVLCHLEVPGIAREDLEIRVEGNVLMIAGEKKLQVQHTQKDGGFRSAERRYGRFERSFALPRTVDAGNVRASCDNGVLTIVLPKVEASKPRRIEISDGANNQALNS